MEWFESWFDSPYYHILYQNRDLAEAERFVRTLNEELQAPQHSSMLDLACGKGRYAKVLAEYGHDVVGLDLSIESIQFAKQFEHERLNFYTHDMRQLFRINYFDYIFNLFTSFGYFKTDREHLRVFKNISKGLRKNGFFIFDYFNLNRVANKLVPEEEIIRDSIRFTINRKIDETHVTKRIRVHDGSVHHFEERVRAFSASDIESMLNQSDLQVIKRFGDYQLTSFDADESERLILIAQKL